MTTPASWAIAAAKLPIAFAQVREDPLVDLAVLESIGQKNARGMMIASGGCTAAFISGSGWLSHLHLVDFNPAQMALCRVKLHLMQTAEPTRRLQLMGHLQMDADERASAIADVLRSLDLAEDLFVTRASGPCVACSSELDHAGRYEVLFGYLRGKLADIAADLMAVLQCDNPAERSHAVAAGTTLGNVFDAAFDEVMALPNLVQLCGAEATQNSREPFSRHFARRTRVAIAAMPTADNPYLWQLLVGRFPDGVSYPWFSAGKPRCTFDYTIGTIDSALERADGEFDFLHLSNVLDWLSVDEAKRTMDLAFNAMASGGAVVIRQLNSTLDLQALGPKFEWMTCEAHRLHTGDRSFFYNSLHLGRKS